MRLREIVEGNRTFIEWSVALDAQPMPSAGTNCFSPGFRIGPIRLRGRWRAALPDAVYCIQSESSLSHAPS